MQERINIPAALMPASEQTPCRSCFDVRTLSPQNPISIAHRSRENAALIASCLSETRSWMRKFTTITSCLSRDSCCTSNRARRPEINETDGKYEDLIANWPQGHQLLSRDSIP